MLRDRIRLVTVSLILGLIGLTAVLWFVVISPRLSIAGELELKSADIELTNLGLLKRQRDFLDLADRAPQAAAEAQILFSRMPETAQLPSLLDQIGQAALEAGISPSSIQVINASIPVSTTEATQGSATETQKALGVQLATLELDMTVDGSQANLLTFMENLQELDRALLITSTDLVDLPLQVEGSEQSLTISATLFVLESSLPDLVTNAQAIIDRAQAESGVAQASSVNSLTIERD